MFDVVHHLLQNIILIVGEHQLNFVFQGFYGVRFVLVHFLLQEAPKKDIWR
jgi:hypothetical protein